MKTGSAVTKKGKTMLAYCKRFHAERRKNVHVEHLCDECKRLNSQPFDDDAYATDQMKARTGKTSRYSQGGRTMPEYDVRIAIPRSPKAYPGELVAVRNTLDGAKTEVQRLYDTGYAALCTIYCRWEDIDGYFHYDKVPV